VQTTAATAGRRVHDDEAERQQALQVARQGRLLDVELVPDLHGGNAVARGELGEQRVLAGRDAERAHGVVVDAGDDARELAHARGQTRGRRRLGDVGHVGGLFGRAFEGLGHNVHRIASGEIGLTV